ncbi:MAG: hypothetical protein HY391_02930 [Deltaproteobacteria bacterium]|nr:hypothetical protein [Deltaproteobacteria bacterium]
MNEILFKSGTKTMKKAFAIASFFLFIFFCLPTGRSAFGDHKRFFQVQAVFLDQADDSLYIFRWISSDEEMQDAEYATIGWVYGFAESFVNNAVYIYTAKFQGVLDKTQKIRILCQQANYSLEPSEVTIYSTEISLDSTIFNAPSAEEKIKLLKEAFIRALLF